MLRCGLLGHRPRFVADGPTMRWTCARGCGWGGAKEYASSAEAARYARGLDRDDGRDLGRRAPLVGLLPLRALRAWRQRPRRGRPPAEPPPQRG